MTRDHVETLEIADDRESLERRNFVSLTIYQILVRAGWIFKTESVIIPAALDSLGGAGWVRGCLPMLNRVGQSIPPLLAWPLIQSARHQKNWLLTTTATMGLLFCLLSGMWLGGWQRSGATAALIFLVIYGLFFVATGINQLTLSALMGKLIRARLRGRLMLAANTLGSVISISCAWLILRHWLRAGEADFAAIFGTSGSLFLVAAVSSILVREAAREPHELGGYQPRRIFGEVWRTCVADRRFRLLAIISGLFGLSMTLMPHYQNLGRVRLQTGFADLLPWLIIQNTGVALFSIPVGSIADRIGNRAALRIVLLLLITAPLLALVFSRMPLAGRFGFLVVYFLLGLMPVTMRILSNYSLEFTSVGNQPRYLAAQSMAMAVPVIVSSAMVGWLIDRFGYDPVFLLVTACMTSGWLLTFRLHEPRNGESADKSG
jgi:hypothetical protein